MFFYACNAIAVEVSVEVTRNLDDSKHVNDIVAISYV